MRNIMRQVWGNRNGGDKIDRFSGAFYPVLEFFTCEK